MIKKELFVEIMEEIKKCDTYQKKFNDFLRKNGAEGWIFQPDCSTIMIKTLKEIFNNTDTIDYFIECDYGKKHKEGDYLYNGNPVDLSTAELLYDHLIELKEGD